MTRRGCGCCGGGPTPSGECCDGCDFSNATITNLVATKGGSDPESWTQNGPSVLRTDVGEGCRFDVPVSSNINGQQTLIVSHQGGGYSNDVLDPNLL
ncbi:MAG: hypothetical protein AAF709_21640, partial [Pseudomonadota bacterium]